VEYDNDRILRPPNRIEIFFWAFLGLMNPLFNSLTIFKWDLPIDLLILLVNCLVVPVYIIYSRLIVPRFLNQKPYWKFIIISLGCFFFTQFFIAGIYSIILQLSLTGPVRTYFSFTGTTIIRESLWSLINLFFALAIAFLRKSYQEEEVLVNLQKDNTLFKLKYLRSQLSPHFLFNTLNSIYSLSLQKSDRTPEVVVKLADIMRYLIYECNESQISLAKEIDFIRNYIEIEKIRYKADVQFSVEGPVEGKMIEPSLFISFIENGFKHALDSSFTNPFIYVTIKIDEDKVTLTVINNTNIDLETQAKRINGASIRNSRTLLDILYPDSHALNIIQTEKQARQKTLANIRNARRRLEMFYPDSHTLDMILSNNAFTVSLIVKHQPL
jgi:two-component system, LytTR family, sensor kinase